MIRFLINMVLFVLRLLPLVIVYIALYRDPGHQRLKKAGFQEKDSIVGDVRFHYAESAGSGKPPLLLLHAQLLDWFSYRNVMIQLAEHYHVYAADYPGHGKTRCPDDYEMNAEQIGSSLAQFIEEVIGSPVYISGNSSGGLLAAWLAANRPDLVRAVILEAPPLFASEYPAVKNTVAYRTFTVSDRAVREDNEGDYVRFWIRNSEGFFKNNAFPGSRILVRILVTVSRMLHWQDTVEIPFVPPLFREMIRGMDQYDPHFGQAFCSGTWNEGFDHAEALCRITCPVLLIQADTSFLADGTLDGAMSEENAQFACSRLQDVRYVKVNAGHVVHLEEPEEYLKHVRAFLETAGTDSRSGESGEV
ncbi:MAG: alpha/beta hydrolase [Solobacterium sp.]|nr:alpha/beta hydrolase [Solobacterium sp.]